MLSANYHMALLEHHYQLLIIAMSFATKKTKESVTRCCPFNWCHGLSPKSKGCDLARITSAPVPCSSEFIEQKKTRRRKPYHSTQALMVARVAMAGKRLRRSLATVTKVYPKA